jgi:hypothetical protein
MCGDRDVLFFASRVGEAKVGVLDLLVFDQLENICGFHFWKSSEEGLSLALNAFAVPAAESFEINELVAMARS